MTCSRLENDDLLADLGGAMDGHVEQCEDCRARLRGYRQIAGLIAQGGTTHRAPPGWTQATLARIHGAAEIPRRRGARFAVIAGASAAAALALVLVLRRDVPPAPVPEPALTMQIVDSGGWRGDAHPGEEVTAHARAPAGSYFEIRVYRGARELLVRCPNAGPPACGRPDGSVLRWKVPSVGTYQVLLLVSPRRIAAPHGSLDDDVAGATAAGARAVDVETVDVH